ETRIGELLERRERLRRPQRDWMLARIAHRNLPLASHDDDTEETIAENLADGIRISEFPVTMVAAKAARVGGMEVIAGAPFFVRGGSHCGNVNAADLIEAGLVDAFASDYVPASMLEAAWGLAASGTLPIPEAIALVTDRPARMARFEDRGHLAPGMRADIARLKPFGVLPVLRGVWVAGVRAG
ncbi:MAG: PhnM protein, partial [Rhodospirillales bacterium]|nr:PhnM protein [Rhodospirillales bacterium]